MKEKYETFSGSTYSDVRICRLSVFHVIVNYLILYLWVWIVGWTK